MSQIFFKTLFFFFDESAKTFLKEVFISASLCHICNIGTMPKIFLGYNIFLTFLLFLLSFLKAAVNQKGII